MSQEQLALSLADQPKERRPLAGFHDQGGNPSLEEALTQAKRNQCQESRVLAYLRAHEGQRFTPPEIARALGIERENSVQRALSNLKKQNLIEKHDRPDEKRPGSWGTDVCTWSAA